MKSLIINNKKTGFQPGRNYKERSFPFSKYNPQVFLRDRKVLNSWALSTINS